jgi:hypothetical protein
MGTLGGGQAKMKSQGRDLYNGIGVFINRDIRVYTHSLSSIMGGHSKKHPVHELGMQLRGRVLD